LENIGKHLIKISIKFLFGVKNREKIGLDNHFNMGIKRKILVKLKKYPKCWVGPYMIVAFVISQLNLIWSINCTVLYSGEFTWISQGELY